MSLLSSLGSVVNVPTLVSTASSITNTGAAGLVGYATQNFKLPGVATKAAELASKVNVTGQLDKFKSLSVGGTTINVPKTPTLPASYLSASADDNTSELKVKIYQDPVVDGGPNQIIFTVMPRIDESGTAEYEAISPLQHPGAIQKYRGSSARTWRVSGRLISRTAEEATENLELINMIRSWRMPFHGVGTANERSTARLLGAPPPILTLSAYGPAMIGPTKCVLTSYDWSFDNALDYIPTINGNPFPVLLDISLSLVESWSPNEYSNFNLVKFKMGDLS